jgi:hypothetical protein
MGGNNGKDRERPNEVIENEIDISSNVSIFLIRWD